MLRKRIVACLVVKNGIVVQSIGFRQYLPVGSIDVCVEALNRWGIDEIVILDIDATAKGINPNYKLLTDCSKKGFVPLTVGGGIRNIQDMKKLIHYGADKVCINKIAILNPEIIKEASAILGNQCIVVSIDVKINKNNQYEVFSDSGHNPTGKDVMGWAKEVESLGVGEIFLNSIDRDGSKKGYDLDLIKMVSQAVDIPVIACGGAGHPKHFLEVLIYGNAYAAAAGNFFHFTEHSPILVKAYLRAHDIDIRLDTYADYSGINFGEPGRILQRSEHYLEKLRFEYQPEEVI